MEVGRAISEVLKHEFRFEPHQAVDQPALTDTEVIVLPPMEVVGSKSSVERAIRSEQEREEGQRFSWTKGGTILKLGPVTMMFTFDPASKSFCFLKF
jgi:hypothetical protein